MVLHGFFFSFALSNIFSFMIFVTFSANDLRKTYLVYTLFSSAPIAFSQPDECYILYAFFPYNMPAKFHVFFQLLSTFFL